MKLIAQTHVSLLVDQNILVCQQYFDNLRMVPEGRLRKRALSFLYTIKRVKECDTT